MSESESGGLGASYPEMDKAPWGVVARVPSGDGDTVFLFVETDGETGVVALTTGGVRHLGFYGGAWEA